MEVGPQLTVTPPPSTNLRHQDQIEDSSSDHSTAMQDSMATSSHQSAIPGQDKRFPSPVPRNTLEEQEDMIVESVIDSENFFYEAGNTAFLSSDQSDNTSSNKNIRGESSLESLVDPILDSYKEDISEISSGVETAGVEIPSKDDFHAGSPASSGTSSQEGEPTGRVVGNYNLRNYQQRSYAHLHANVEVQEMEPFIHKVMTQLSLQQGLRKFKERREEAVISKLSQIHMMNRF